MAKHRRLPDDAPVTATADSGATYWSVAEGDWPAVEPTLPPEMADLLAPPIVVGVARVVATSRMTPPADADLPPRTTGGIRSGAAAGRPVPGATTVRLAAPAASRPTTPAPGRRPAPGRHRNAGADRTA
ncbi:hypothetical protein ONA91_14665 [Micromonospora sp. DR5-3]|uniref:hypothetical protein n=1 Tax=unclassified Micromonospora TaxID=2617518 RepID=UPI0011D85DF4|nr:MULTISPECIES: hypothetical protein [unclassified Micromonospora]MCW3815697.1 hypothetical protein [Micromonospora sp. DR5-3]TYC23851.1 hypothetical protein FXF52_13685 [Micromonospora sp. MP36]